MKVHSAGCLLGARTHVLVSTAEHTSRTSVLQIALCEVYSSSNPTVRLTQGHF